MASAPKAAVPDHAARPGGQVPAAPCRTATKLPNLPTPVRHVHRPPTLGSTNCPAALATPHRLVTRSLVSEGWARLACVVEAAAPRVRRLRRRTDGSSSWHRRAPMMRWADTVAVDPRAPATPRRGHHPRRPNSWVAWCGRLRRSDRPETTASTSSTASPAWPAPSLRPRPATAPLDHQPRDTADGGGRIHRRATRPTPPSPPRTATRESDAVRLIVDTSPS